MKTNRRYRGRETGREREGEREKEEREKYFRDLIHRTMGTAVMKICRAEDQQAGRPGRECLSLLECEGSL